MTIGIDKLGQNHVAPIDWLIFSPVLNTNLGGGWDTKKLRKLDEVVGEINGMVHCKDKGVVKIELVGHITLIYGKYGMTKDTLDIDGTKGPIFPMV